MIQLIYKIKTLTVDNNCVIIKNDVLLKNSRCDVCTIQIKLIIYLK